MFSDVFFYLKMGDPFFEPFGGRFSFKMVVKKFPHPQGIVYLIGRLSQAMSFPFVLEHDHRLPEASQRIEILNSLVPLHSSIFVVHHNEKWCLHVFGMINGRIPDEIIEVIPIAIFGKSRATFKNG
jgi:hypothetical protein